MTQPTRNTNRQPAKAPPPPAKTFPSYVFGARMSPFKARPLVDLVRGKPVEQALKLLEFEPRRAAPMIRKILKSAIANASSDQDVKLGRLVVVEARVDGGPLLSGRRRWRPRAMGRAFPIMKRTCHIRLALGEAAEQPQPTTESGASKPASQTKSSGPSRSSGKSKSSGKSQSSEKKE